MGLRIYRVVGDSMSPSFKTGELLLVRVSAYKNQHPRRGDVVIAIDPRCYSRHSLKRVVGLPREEVRLADGMLWIDGNVFRESYLCGRPSNLELDEQYWQLRHGEYFMMGDNRVHSTDSRTYGPVPASQIEGKVVARIWPFRRISLTASF